LLVLKSFTHQSYILKSYILFLLSYPHNKIILTLFRYLWAVKKFVGILRYVKGYWNYGVLNIICNIFSVIFGLFSLTMLAPFLKFLFADENGEIQRILLNGKPAVQLSASNLIDHFNYYLAVFIEEDGKLKALIFICITFTIMIFLKNFFRYLAMYFVTPIRNGVVRDIRNNMMTKVMNLHLGYFSEER
jgi:subfamily B ATP-binding cassette protein MsbA